MWSTTYCFWEQFYNFYSLQMINTYMCSLIRFKIETQFRYVCYRFSSRQLTYVFKSTFTHWRVIHINCSLQCLTKKYKKLREINLTTVSMRCVGGVIDHTHRKYLGAINHFTINMQLMHVFILLHLPLNDANCCTGCYNATHIIKLFTSSAGYA